MKTIYIRGDKKKKNTAVRVLTEHLVGYGHTVVRSKEEPHDVTVCWGVSTQETPSLNGRVNQFNKFEAFERFRDAKVLCPITFERDILEWVIKNRPDLVQQSPWLARKFHHKGGTDIVEITSLAQARRANCDFFSVYIPTRTEYRVWVWKNKAFAVYEKQFEGKGEYEGIQRNRHFGFKFVKQDNLLVGDRLIRPAIEAVKALDMDFGAVDILMGKDANYYVLEVNSMPNVQNTKRSCGVRLATRISKWAEAQ